MGGFAVRSRLHSLRERGASSTADRSMKIFSTNLSSSFVVMVMCDVAPLSVVVKRASDVEIEVVSRQGTTFEIVVL